MHSSQYLRLAQAADQNGWVIIAMAELPASEGTYPSAWCVCEREFSLQPGRTFLVSQGVIPTEGDREAFFGSSIYDCARERAFEVFGQKVARDCATADGVVA